MNTDINNKSTHITRCSVCEELIDRCNCNDICPDCHGHDCVCDGNLHDTISDGDTSDNFWVTYHKELIDGRNARKHGHSPVYILGDEKGADSDRHHQYIQGYIDGYVS